MADIVLLRDRDAEATIRGFVYQVDLTILRWLDLQHDQQLELERGEDIDLVSQAIKEPNHELRKQILEQVTHHRDALDLQLTEVTSVPTSTQEPQKRLLEQIKHREKALSLMSPEAVAALVNFFEHRKANPHLSLAFRYTTNAGIRPEKSSPLLERIPAILAWQQVRQQIFREPQLSQVLEGITALLHRLSEGGRRPADIQVARWNEFRLFTQNIDRDQLLSLIQAFEWRTNTEDVLELRHHLQRRLIEDGYAIDDTRARACYLHLFFHVFQVLSQSGPKILNVEGRTHLLRQTFPVPQDEALVERLREMFDLLEILDERVNEIEIRELFRDERIDNMQAQLWQRPRQDVSLLPAVSPLPYHLVGRADLLHKLKQQLFEKNQAVLSSLYGLPGVGKTALAVALVYDPEVLAHFSDGVLWAGLGRQAGEDDVFAQLESWALIVGVTQAEVQQLTDLSSLRQSIRTALGQRKILVVIDDVWNVELAWNLKIGGPNCAYLVTTRLPEVAVRFANSEVMFVRELNEADGLQLLSQLAPNVVGDEPDEARELIRVVGGLPLALRLMGNYLRVHGYSGQKRRVRNALQRVHDIEGRLGIEEPQGEIGYHPSLPANTPLSLQAVIEISYEALDELSRSALRALSTFLAKPNNFSEEAALAVASTTAKALDALVDSGLLEVSGGSRYMLHQTIADYAAYLLIDRKAERQSVCARLVDYYVNYAEIHKRDLDALEQESSNVLTALQVATEQRLHLALVLGVNAFTYYWETRGLYTLAYEYAKKSQRAAESLNDPLYAAISLLNLGRIENRLGDSASGAAYFQEGLELAKQSKNFDLVEAFLKNLVVLWAQRGEYKLAEAVWQNELQLARQRGDCRSVAHVSHDLAVLVDNQGDYDRALALLQEALLCARELADSVNICSVLTTLGLVNIHRGELGRALESLQEALPLASSLGYSEMICSILDEMAWVATFRSEYDLALRYLQEALPLARQIGSSDKVSSILATQGAVAINLKKYNQAEEYLQEGLVLARQMRHGERTCTLLCDLGSLAAAQEQYVRAEGYWREALTLARSMGQFAGMSVLLTNLTTLADLHEDRQKVEAYVHEWMALPHRDGRIEPIMMSILENLGATSLIRKEYEQAEGFLREGVSLARKIGKTESLIRLLANLGTATAFVKGRYEQAELYFQEVTTLAREMGQTEILPSIFESLGSVAALRGKYELMETYWQEGLAPLCEEGYTEEVGNILNRWGDLCTQLHQLTVASICFQRALVVSQGVNHVHAAAALYGLARIAFVQGNKGEAYRQGTASLTLFESIDQVKAAEIQQFLANL